MDFQDVFNSGIHTVAVGNNIGYLNKMIIVFLLLKFFQLNVSLKKKTLGESIVISEKVVYFLHLKVKKKKSEQVLYVITNKKVAV